MTDWWVTHKVGGWTTGHSRPRKYLPGWVDWWLVGLAGNIAISAQLKLELGLSLAKMGGWMTGSNSKHRASE